MQMGTHLETKKEERNIILLLLMAIILLFLCLNYLNFTCLWKLVFKIPCPTCGMTRAMHQIFAGHIINSFSYNILAFPVIVVMAISIILIPIDLITKKNNLLKLYSFFIRHYLILIIIPLLISWIINIIRGI